MATQDLTEQLRSYFGVPPNLGVLVSTVKAGSIGDTAGVKTGDILVELNGVTITNAISYQVALSSITPGRQVKAVVFRDKARKEITFDIPEQPHGQLSPHDSSRIVKVANL
jgi:serine protease Do